MSDLLPKVLLDEIENLIQNKAGDVKSRDARLWQLADTGWAALFPEDRQAGAQRPTNETRRQRWQAVIVTIQVFCAGSQPVRTRNPAQPNSANRRPLVVLPDPLR